MHPQALAAIATLVSFARQGNRIEFELDRGRAEIVWVSPRTFHFRRTLDGPLPPSQAEAQIDPVALQVDDIPGAVRIRSKYLDVALQKHGLLVKVHRIDGEPIMADLSEPKQEGNTFTWEREAAPGVRFYGLGPSSDAQFDLRGQAVDTLAPFLISTAGYGESHNGAGMFHFDFTAAGRYRINGPAIDYYFYYGPTPKAIFHERKGAPEIALPITNPPPPSWAALRNDLLGAVHQAMSSPTLPRFNLGAYAGAPDELKQRARQFGSLLPDVIPGTVELSSFRRQLTSFFDIYEIDKRDQGYPVWHPLPFQFPDDPECARHADEFMLGDEMLLAPFYESGVKRTVYLPPGNWTNLETNREFPGRQTITVETKGLPVFARNGTIVPLDSEGGVGLHYFPKLGAEFFLLEKGAGEYTQIHAAPALDIMRLEIESKKQRDYQWVVHHVERPAEVGFEEQKYRAVESAAALADHTWFYDAASKNLMIRARVKAGEDNIINLSW